MGRRHLSSLVALLPVLAATSKVDVEASWPRGVGPEFAAHYQDPASFTCITDSTIQIPAARVNDDYCDCPDGSDEPGTAACAALSPLSPPVPPHSRTPALPGFYCHNKGHVPAYLPFTRVNDGTCDYDVCCDGSDEHGRVGGVTCENRCAAIGREWRKQDEVRQRSLHAARQRRAELVATAARLRSEVEHRIATLQTQIEGHARKVDGLTQRLAETERSERGRVVRGAGQGGAVTVLAGLARQRIQELTDSVQRVRGERDAASARVRELEALLRRFKDEYNPNFNDEGVKRAVKAWEDYAAQDRPAAADDALDRELDELLAPDAASAIPWDDFETADPASDVELLYQFEAYLPVAMREWVDGKLRDLRSLLVNNGILAHPPPTDAPESKLVSDARAQLDAATHELDQDKAELTRQQDDLGKDYGPDHVFRALADTCISTDSGEYTYEHCFLGSTTQKSKKGGGHTGMGTFARIDSVQVDEALPADGRGVGSGERMALRYENGQQCWNGPHRSTLVVLACAQADEIWKIIEEEKCVYRMEVGTPAVCGVEVVGQERGGERVHGEL